MLSSRYLFVFFGVLATAVTAYLTLPQPASIISSSARLTAATALTDSAGANLVVNGSFESPSQASAVTEYSAGSTGMPGWTVGGDSVDLVGSSYFQAEDGNQSLDLSGSTSGSVSQTVTTAPGSNYTLTWYMAGNPNCGQPVKTMRVSWGGQVVATRTFDTSTTTGTSMGWTEEQINVQATGAASVLEFADATPDASQCGATLDNVSLSAAQQVPPVFTQDSPALDALAGAPYSAIFFAEGVPVYQLVNAPSWLTIAGNGAVTGTPPAGTSSFSYSVSASNAFGNAVAGPYTVTIQTAAAVTGTVVDGGIAANPVAGASVQACVTGGGECQQATTASDGTYSVNAPVGSSVVVSAFPKPGTGDVATSTVPLTIPAGGIQGETISLDGVAPLPSGLEINGTSAPTVYWANPSNVTLTGCPDGYATVTVIGENTQTGLYDSNVVVLDETAPGSGSYAGVIPPEEPVHGPVEVQGSVTCPPKSPLVPSSGPGTGGTAVSVTGSGFTGATGVSFGTAQAASFTVSSDDVIQAVAPAGSGTVPVTVDNGSSSIVVGQYTYVAITSVSPATGPAAGGTKVVITGTGLGSASGVFFGSTSADFTQVSSTEIDAVSPPGTGTQDITVDTFFGGDTPASPAGQFTYGGGSSTSATRAVLVPGQTEAAPHQSHSSVLTAHLRPAASAASSATLQQIENYISQNASALTQEAQAQILAIVKSAAAHIKAACAGGVQEANTIAQQIYKPLILPQVSLFSAEAALEVTAGLGLGAAEAVIVSALLFGLFALTAFALTISVILAIFAVCNFAADAFIDPSGTVLDTNGNPVSGATATILRSDTAAGPFTPVDSTAPGIQPAVNPETTASDGVFHWDVFSGWYEIRASAPGCTAPGDPGQSTVTAGPYPVPPPQTGLTITMACAGEPPAPRPVISSVSQGTGPATGGTQVTILGTGFTPGSKVTFGSTPASSVTYQSTQALSVVSPAGSGLVDLRVQTAGGTSATVAADQFYFGSPPTVTGVSPGHGPASGGTTVNITGTGFTGATAVAFGALPATAYTVISDTQIQATAPAHLPGIADVLVINPAGTSTAGPADQFTYDSQPSIDHEVTASGTSAATATLSAAQGDLIVAFVSADGSPLAAQQATVSGGGLTWTVARSTGIKSGMAAIWTARATSPLSGAAISAVLGTPGYREMLTVIAFANATGVGRTVSASGGSSAPIASLTTSVPESWVFGVGYNHSPVSKPALTPGSGQTLISQGSGTGSTFWTQNIAAPTPQTGTTVTINDTAPGLNLWALTLIEIG